MDYTLNIVSKCRFFSLYLNICGLQKGPGKFFMGSWKFLEKYWIFFVSKSVGTLSLKGSSGKMAVKTEYVCAQIVADAERPRSSCFVVVRCRVRVKSAGVRRSAGPYPSHAVCVHVHPAHREPVQHAHQEFGVVGLGHRAQVSRWSFAHSAVTRSLRSVL